MTEITSDFKGQTVICTFEMTPATADELKIGRAHV